MAVLFILLLSLLIQMLRPEEVEMLVCGNPELDMDALRKVTVYDGYTKDDSVIRLVLNNDNETWMF